MGMARKQYDTTKQCLQTRVTNYGLWDKNYIKFWKSNFALILENQAGWSLETYCLEFRISTYLIII